MNVLEWLRRSLTILMSIPSCSASVAQVCLKPCSVSRSPTAISGSESEQFDRPLVRHLHRSEVESARTQLKWLPAAVEDGRAEVADLKREIESLERRSLVDRLGEGREKNLNAELVELRSQLTDDARARGHDLADDVSDVVRNRLGRRVPSGKATREAWIEAAGRMAQHQAAWDVREEHMLGRKPQVFRDDAYELTWHAAAKSMSALDRSVGRRLEREVPSRGLSR